MTFIIVRLLNLSCVIVEKKFQYLGARALNDCSPGFTNMEQNQKHSLLPASGKAFKILLVIVRSIIIIFCVSFFLYLFIYLFKFLLFFLLL